MSNLPPTLPLWSDDPDQPSAGRLCGLGRQLTYEAARRGQIPTIRFGTRALRVPTKKLLALLGEEQT